MFKEFLLKKALQSKLKDVPLAQQEKILKAVEKDPQLFMRIAEEIKAKTTCLRATHRQTDGKDQMVVAMEVLTSHQEEIGKLIS